MKEEILLAKNSLSKLSNKTGESRLRFELISIITVLLLSTELFKRNNDVEDFLKLSNIEFKEYVYRSRTLVIARMNKFIVGASIDQLQLLLDSSKKMVFTEKPLNKQPDKSNNDIDDLLNRFSRR